MWRITRGNGKNKAMFIRSELLRRKQIAPEGNTNCDIFSCVSSQLAVWAWNMAAMAAASSSLAMLLDITGCFEYRQRGLVDTEENRSVPGWSSCSWVVVFLLYHRSVSTLLPCAMLYPMNCQIAEPFLKLVLQE
jgi:hypothetical protein